MTPLWAKRFAYQVFSFLVSIAMVAGVATYTFSKSYDERKLTFVDGFMITAHTGAFDTPDNSLETIKKAIENGADAVELDIRQRPDGTVVMGHDIITTNNDGVEIDSAFELIASDEKLMVNLDIKDIKALPALYEKIKAFSLQKRVYLTGIETFQAKDAKRDCPGIDYYINYVPSRFNIFADDYQKRLLKMLEETGGIGINCNHANASRTLSDFLHQNGYKLSVWTVDKEYQMKRALVNKPDNITTRNVNELRDVIENWGNK